MDAPTKNPTGRPRGYVRSPLERARHSRTLMVRSLDRQTRKHVADMTARHHKITALTAEIERREAEEGTKRA